MGVCVCVREDWRMQMAQGVSNPEDKAELIQAFRLKRKPAQTSRALAEVIKQERPCR